jgi:RNA polymerase primary sigma factor
VRVLEREVERSVRQLVAGHQSLVGAVARRYRGLGLSREDLAQEGNIGLLRAIEKFDPERGASFATYAVWWVRQAIRSALASQARTVRLPASALSTRYTLGRAASRLSHELGREPDARELALATGVAAESVTELMRWATEPLSLDALRGENQNHTIGDRVSDPDAPSPYDQAIARDSAARLQVLLGALSPREQLIIRRRFGLHGADEQTLEEIGRSLALTRERVRQIVNRALTRLEQRSHQVHLEP